MVTTDDDRESGIHVSDGETMDTDSRPCGPTSPGQSGLPQYWHKRLRSFSVGELHMYNRTALAIACNRQCMLKYIQNAPSKADEP